MQQLGIALIGYGRMGQAIEKIAVARGHRITIHIDKGESHLFDDARFLASDVAIEFTHPESAFANCSSCLDRGIPVVSGTTGWANQLSALAKRCQEEHKTLFWASNFSVGVNLFFEINKYVARLMTIAPEYELSISETHHIHKLDAPSGTAITLAEAILSERPELGGWVGEPATDSVGKLPIESVRQGEVPGIHTTTYRSSVDSISLTHEAKSREGFALGAVLAAEYASVHQGFLGMSDLLNLDNLLNK